jgi:hypothetical protein
MPRCRRVTFDANSLRCVAGSHRGRGPLFAADQIGYNPVDTKKRRRSRTRATPVRDGGTVSEGIHQRFIGRTVLCPRIVPRRAMADREDRRDCIHREGALSELGRSRLLLLTGHRPFRFALGAIPVQLDPLAPNGVLEMDTARGSAMNAALRPPKRNRRIGHSVK